MRILIAESHKSLRAVGAKQTPQITWHRVGTFPTPFLKNMFKTLKQTGVEHAEVWLEGDTVVIDYGSGRYRLNSEPVRGDVHLFRPWFDLGATPECNETEIEDRSTPEFRRANFRVLNGGAA